MIQNTNSETLRIGIIGGVGFVPASYALSTREVFQFCGNTGNLAFRYAVSLHVESSKQYFSWHSDPSLVKESCDLILFPAANQINPRHDWGRMADFIEKVNLPCLLVGLGAQSLDFEPNLHLQLQKGTVRWLHAIAERSISIGVRGDYTAEILGKMGIHNTEVIGCPTNFISRHIDLGTIIEKKFANLVPNQIVITDGAGRAKLKELERKLIDWMCIYNSKYICQSPENMVKLARKRFDEIPTDWLSSFHKYLTPHLSYEEFVIFVKKYFLVFFDTSAWLEFLSSVDLSLGTRLHGNMLAIQSLTPSICICHDSRTQELCQTMMIPHVSQQEFMKAKDIYELIDFASFDGLAFDKNRIKLAFKYRKLLTRYGIKVNSHVENIADLYSANENRVSAREIKL